jgi:hypothetical protein
VLRPRPRLDKLNVREVRCDEQKFEKRFSWSSVSDMFRSRHLALKRLSKSLWDRFGNGDGWGIGM